MYLRHRVTLRTTFIWCYELRSDRQSGRFVRTCAICLTAMFRWTDYVKIISAASCSFYCGHLTLDKKLKKNILGVFSILYFRQSMTTLTQREDNARSNKISASTVKDMDKIQHSQTCEIFSPSIRLLFFIA